MNWYLRRVLAVCVFGCGTAHAQPASLNVGALEAMGTDGTHYGVYPNAGVGTAVAVAEKTTLVPAAGIEWSPEFGRWGFWAALTLDYALGESVGLDFGIGGAHDQSGLDWGDALFFAGGGPGFSVFLGDWTVSPFVNLWANLADGSLAVIPGANVAYTLRL